MFHAALAGRGNLRFRAGACTAWRPRAGWAFIAGVLAASSMFGGACCASLHTSVALMLK